MKTTTLTEADNGKSLRVGLGDAVVIRLSENPTTGYRWSVENADQSVFQVKSDFIASSGAGVGSGGEHTFTLSFQKAGTALLQLRQWREWEGDRSVIAHFSVSITVVG